MIKITPEMIFEQYAKVGEKIMPILQELMLKDHLHPFSVYLACMMITKGFKEYSKALCTDDKGLEDVMNQIEKAMGDDATAKLFPKIKMHLDEGRKEEGWNQYDNKANDQK